MELVFDISDLQVATQEELHKRHSDWPEEAISQVWQQRADILKQHETMLALETPGYQRKVQFRYFERAKSGEKAEK